LGYDAVSLGSWCPEFQDNIVVLPSRVKRWANIRNKLPSDMSHHSTDMSATLLQKPQKSLLHIKGNFMYTKQDKSNGFRLHYLSFWIEFFL